MPPIANTRMYEAGEQRRRLWNALAAHISNSSGVPLRVVEYAPPAPMTDLWNRPDKGLVQMCGRPFWLSDPQPGAVAAPVPDRPYCRDRPLYRTDMAVRRDDAAATLKDLFGRWIGWTAELRTIAVSDLAPMPPFVASSGVPQDELERLRQSAAQAHRTPDARRIMDDLGVRRFVRPEDEFYRTTERRSREAMAEGYAEPA